MGDLSEDEVHGAGPGQRLATPDSVTSKPGDALLSRLFRRVFTPDPSVYWVRRVMDRETRKLVQGVEPHQRDALELSGDYWGRVEQFKSYRSVHYPEFDVCASALDEQFDLIFAEQVFEHLLWPYRAGKHVYQMLRPGGYFLMTTPFLIRIHGVPVDCSRWTETGIRYFLAECGFDLDRITTGSWGNIACVRANFWRWARYRRFWHSLHNEPNFPVSVWAFAQK
ncbi:methyltransferase domain-containing protein [Mycobacterium sp. 663a-19]|uniref:class I SAM-dependent methyltransferase n=1 Tax=Mycobacterium sp. 663a-19 TaxID=2986148 RepID=UPI002D1F10DA|nr:methyltransferase domain-containing protein [Mycobacterium sp. 663a-19]MEB3983927.1 methyltransferase domain-containing protein [Mycobacterium sp. 663a-19]